MRKVFSEGSSILEPSKYFRLRYSESLKVPELYSVESNISYIIRPITPPKYQFASARTKSCAVSACYNGMKSSSSQCIGCCGGVDLR
jgi:hypothetical protein